jgi:choline-sulfatase
MLHAGESSPLVTCFPSFVRTSAFLFLLLFVPLSGCRSPDKQGSDGLARARHVLLVTIDTWRWDHIGVSGKSPVPTPNLDALARAGAYFSNAWASTPLTTPSHASIFTGLFPTGTGVRDNGGARLTPRDTTLAELFFRKGYSTAAFVSAATVSRTFGFDRGFEVFVDDFAHAGRDLDRSANQIRGDVTAGRFLEWLRHSRDLDRWFAWVHFFDPHTDYDAPGTPPDAPWRTAYGLEVRYVDSLIGRMRQALSNDDNVLWCVLADHGEGLGDHGELTHGFALFATTTRIPLFFSGAAVPGRGTFDVLAKTEDVLPTLLDLAGAGPAPRVDGRSLAPVLRGGKLDEKPVYIESWGGRSIGGPQVAPLYGAVSSVAKVVVGPKPEVYDLAKDAEERHNLSGRPSNELPPDTDELRAWATSLFENGHTGSFKLDATTRQALSSLGYLPSSGTLGPFKDNELTDPKDLLPWELKLGLLTRASRTGDLKQLEKSLLEIVDVFPQALDAANQLGLVLKREGRVDEAINQFRAVLTKQPPHVEARLNLAATLWESKRLAEARKEAETALSFSPDDPRALHILGAICSDAGDYNCLGRAWTRLLEIAPHHEAAASVRETLRLLAEGHAPPPISPVAGQ